MNQTDAAYLAGIIDGEGMVRLGGRKNRNPNKPPYITPTVSVSNTYLPLLQWLHSELGGSIYFNKDSRPTRKPIWQWSVAGQKAITTLRLARPYLKIKTEQADICINIYRARDSRRDSRGRLVPTLSDRQMQENMALKERIRILNQRGPHEIPSAVPAIIQGYCSKVA